MRLHIGKAFNSFKLTDYLEEEEARIKGKHVNSGNNRILPNDADDDKIDLPITIP